MLNSYLYNAIDELSEMLKSVNNISAKQVILLRDFKLYFDSKAKIEILYSCKSLLTKQIS